MRWINKKDTVEDSTSLDLLSLQKKGVFKMGPGHRWTCTWSRGSEVRSSIAYTLESISHQNFNLALRFEYNHTPPNGEKKNLDYLVPVVSTPCHLGGKRWWFLCPLSNCLRRCRIMYLPDGSRYFGCRECHKLTYESRQMHRLGVYESYIRPEKKMQKILNKLEKARCPKKIIKLRSEYLLLNKSSGKLIEQYLESRRKQIDGQPISN